MTKAAGNDVWDAFWAQNARAPGGVSADGGGCLPQRWAAIEDAQRGAWANFVAPLPQDARLLDLATGDGRVLRWIQELRKDLVLTGTDLAPQLPPAPTGIAIQAGVAMEQLPFDDASFDAVTSQFGFEYGETDKVVAEISRVLAPSGQVGLMMHRGDGPILEHNSKRRDEIDWVLGSAEVMRRVRKKIKKQAELASIVNMAAKIADEGAKRFGENSPGWEIAEAVRRTLVMGARSGVQSVLDTLKAIESQAQNEIGRISSLENACATADNREAIIAAFANHKIVERNTQDVCEPSGRAFADIVAFERS